ncbi:MAG: 5-deoxy-glucuronate isomerase [Pseudomonadota bacterium]
MHPHLIQPPLGGFRAGLTVITELGDPDGVDLRFALLRLAPGERFTAIEPGLETAALLLSGDVRLHLDGATLPARRAGPFEDDPVCLHLSAQAHLEAIAAEQSSELAIFQVRNPAPFPPMLFDADTMMEREERGQGLWGDAAWRVVRTIFDDRNRPEANLVLGEVLNRAGRWSSYPPHHHPQPELYHYRFERGEGYGHCELGEEVVRVRDGDTVRILDERDHPQVAAPGYRMLYLWAIRHLPGQRYRVPEFTAEHRWLLG